MDEVGPPFSVATDCKELREELMRRRDEEQLAACSLSMAGWPARGRNSDGLPVRNDPGCAFVVELQADQLPHQRRVRPAQLPARGHPTIGPPQRYSSPHRTYISVRQSVMRPSFGLELVANSQSGYPR